jgi:O-acetyl-ADP-ribose deacetylase (regulator of RNase III)/uncharacterized protein YwgA
MSVTFKSGDMFAEPVEAIVNTVNCVGVMGKGVALEFKNRWPENFKQYKKLCRDHWLRPGRVFVFENHNMFGPAEPRFLVNFPTKDHWRGKSELSYIRDGLDDLVVQLRAHQIKSIALPPLGCGNGGLDWADVKPIIQSKLADVGVEVVVFAPDQRAQQRNEENKRAPKMTFARAVLLKILGEFEDYFGGGFTRITLQKIVYFLQSLGLDYGISFSRNEFGPYSDELRDIFMKMEQQHFITGFSSEDRITTVEAEAYKQAKDFLASNRGEEAETIVRKLSLLTEGYESPMGMELLSSVHYLNETERLSSVDKIVGALSAWSNRKGMDFDARTVGLAFDRLHQDGLLN